MDFNIIDLKYNDRIRNLDIKAKGKVKSEKNFPVFCIDNKEYIFKPLSKSKPFCTPCFAFSEVYWSNIINKYFDNKAPIYRLSICDDYEKNQSKYRNQGTIVPNLINEKQKLVNLLEYFRNNNDKNVDINNYINYCGKYYDYTCIFNSKLIEDNIFLGEELAKQVLISILKVDTNYHYENVNFLFEEGNLKNLAAPIDHEFSSLFMYPDNNGLFLLNINPFINTLQNDIKAEEYITNNIECILNNINLIVERYPNIVKEFINNINNLLKDIDSLNIIFDERYLYPFSSFDFEEYKKEENYSKIYNPKYKKQLLNIKEYFNKIKIYTIIVSLLLEKLLTKKIEEENNIKKIIKKP